MKLQLDPSIHYALALEGGGAKGAYQIGAWRALKEAGIQIDAVSGTSVGALNGAMVAMDDLEKAEEIWSNIRFSQVIDVDDTAMSKLLRGDFLSLDPKTTLKHFRDIALNGGLDVTPLRNWISELVDPEKIKNSPRDLYIVTYSLTEHKELELTARELEREDLEDMLLASAYLPVFRNEKLGGKRYMDGGVRDVLPLHVLMQNGYRHIIAPRLHGVGLERPVLVSSTVKLYVIEPCEDLGGTLEFEQSRSRRNLRLGYLDTARLLYGLRGRKYYIDAELDEKESLELLTGLLCRNGSVGMRRLYEDLLPALAGSLKMHDGDYVDLCAALLEKAAEAVGLDPLAIYTEKDLLAVPGLREAAERLAELPPERIPARKSLQKVFRSDAASDRELRVLLMNDSFPPRIDGVANAVLNYARIIENGLGRCGVATPEDPGAVDDYPFPVIRYPSISAEKLTGYRAGNPFDAGTIVRLGEMGFNLIHSHSPFTSTVLARSVREEINAPIVYTYHSKFDMDIARTVKTDFMRKTVARVLVNNISACDEVWVVSHGAGENLRSLGYKGDYIVMPNGVDMVPGRAGEEAVSALSREWNLPENVPVYLFVGRMQWYKGQRNILNALAAVKAKGKDFRMVFVGDGLEAADIRKYAEELGLSDKCRFTGAIRDRELLRAWYTRADLLLFPSTYDTNGLVVREAAACSLGSLLIRGSAAAEGVTDGVNGILVADGEETAGEMAEILASPGLSLSGLHRLGERARKDLYYSWEDSVSDACSRYRIVLENWQRGELRRKKTGMDDLFDISGDFARALENSRKFLNPDEGL